MLINYTLKYALSRPTQGPTFKLENPNDWRASICTSELCKERSIKLGL